MGGSIAAGSPERNPPAPARPTERRSPGRGRAEITAFSAEQPQKMHLPLSERPAESNTLEGLRKRLRVKKGY